jgi:hypothetical protein
MKKNWLLWGAVAVGAYLIYKRMNKSTGTGKEIAPPPATAKPKPSVTASENTIAEETAEGL